MKSFYKLLLIGPILLTGFFTLGIHAVSIGNPPLFILSMLLGFLSLVLTVFCWCDKLELHEKFIDWLSKDGWK